MEDASEITEETSTPSHERLSFNDTELDEERAKWLPSILAKDSSILALRERMLVQTGGYSFACNKFAEKTVCDSHFNKFTSLELIYQHLNAIGMIQTAETLQLESGLDFQVNENQSFERTSLRILTSLGVLEGEDEWDIQPEPNINYVPANTEKICQKTLYDEPINTLKELVNLKEKSNDIDILQPTLSQLVARLIFTDLNEYEKELLFIIILIHVPSQHFLKHLFAIYDCDKKYNEMSEESKIFFTTHSSALKFSTVAMLAGWIRYFGTYIESRALKDISDFITTKKLRNSELQHEFNNIEFLLKEISPGKYRPLKEEPSCAPIISDATLVLNPNTRIDKFNAEEVARQITLIFYTEFRKIPIEEFYYALNDKTISIKSPQINTLMQIGETMSLFFLDQLADSDDRLSTAIFMSDVCSHLYNFCNFEGLRCILQVLRYLQEYKMLPNHQHFSNIMNLWKNLGGNYPDISDYKILMDNAASAKKPTIPNMRIELIYQNDKGKANVQNGKINFGKHKQIAEKIHSLYNYQNISFNFWPVHQMQMNLLREPKRSFEENIKMLSNWK